MLNFALGRLQLWIPMKISNVWTILCLRLSVYINNLELNLNRFIIQNFLCQNGDENVTLQQMDRIEETTVLIFLIESSINKTKRQIEEWSTARSPQRNLEWKNRRLNQCWIVFFARREIVHKEFSSTTNCESSPFRCY